MIITQFVRNMMPMVASAVVGILLKQKKIVAFTRTA